MEKMVMLREFFFFTFSNIQIAKEEEKNKLWYIAVYH